MHGIPSDSRYWVIAAGPGPPTRPRPRLGLPAWLWGGDIVGFAREAGLKLKAVDKGAAIWEVQTLEDYHRTRPRLVTTARLATPATIDGPDVLAALRSLPAQPASVDPTEVDAKLSRLATHVGDLGALGAWASLATTACPTEDLEGRVRAVYQSILALRDQDTDDQLLGDAEVHLVEVDQALGYRYTLVRLLLRLNDSPAEFTTPPSGPASGELFASGRGLFSDTTFGLGAYLNPLLLALSPWAWAISGPRAGAVVVYGLGMPVPGRRGEAAELLQLFSPRGSLPTDRPSGVTSRVMGAAIVWWTEQLNRLFAVITDPANFCDPNGGYQPRVHFETLLGVEQAFRTVQSLLTHDRDTNARRVLLFATLDTLAGIRSPDFDGLCQLTQAQGALAQVKAVVPADAAPVLLHNARRGAEGLRQLQDGFFLPSRVTADGVRLPDKRLGERIVARDQAAAQYLRVLRNATHGFRGNPDKDRSRDEALLMAHNGDLPENLPLLGYLYLLRLLARVDDLALALRGRASR